MRILIAEDEADIREMLGEMLSFAGHEVEFAANYPAAESLLDEQRWDMMMADMVMPGGDGLTLAETARSRGMRALLCTGETHSAEDLAARGISYLQKPFSMSALLAKIDAPPV